MRNLFVFLSVFTVITAPVMASEIYPYTHAHRAIHGSYGFENTKPQSLVDAEILIGLRDGEGEQADIVVTGPQFLNLAHGEQQSAIRSFAGDRTVLLEDGITHKMIGVYSPIAGVQLY